jgi:hypothetical protein
MSKFTPYPIGNAYKVKTNVTAGSATSNTADTLLNSVLVPANTFAAGDVVMMEAMVSKSASLGTYIVRFYWNTTNSLSGAILIGTGASNGTNVRSQVMTRQGLIRTVNGSGTGTLVANSSTAINADNIVTAAPSTLAINWTVDGYFIVSASHTSASETVTGEWLKISTY